MIGALDKVVVVEVVTFNLEVDVENKKWKQKSWTLNDEKKWNILLRQRDWVLNTKPRSSEYTFGMLFS